jgi:hypothetical protein
MAARPIVVAVIWVAMALPAACSGEAYNDACIAEDGCGLKSGLVSGCPKEDEARCCPDGGQNCASELMGCRPQGQCDEVAPTTCVTKGDCWGPPDSRCGEAQCIEGKCELEIWASKQIPNQFPGDCKVNVCSPKGDIAVWTDPSDFPDDGKPCTNDICEGDTPRNVALPDKSLCPGEEHGVCIAGACKDCSAILNLYDCPKDRFCQWDECVVAQCHNNEWEPNEPGYNSGGPCHASGHGDFCFVASDCMSGVCAGKCQEPTHTDGVKNGDETGIDCGYPGGPLNSCNDNEGCLSSSACKSFVCYSGLCQAPTCFDATQNGTETAVDCGGECSPCQN